MKTVLFKNGIKLEVSQNTAETIILDLKHYNEHTKIFTKSEPFLGFFVLSEIVAIY